MKYLISFILLSCMGCSAYAAQETDNASQVKSPSGKILQYGIYTLLRGGEIINSKKSSTGKAVSKPVITRDRITDRIALIKDKYMAYQYRLSNMPDQRLVKLRRVLKHPPMNLPDGTITSGSDYTIKQKVERNEVFAFDSYALNEDYEMVEGEWVFQIWYRQNKLVEQRFTTYWQ